MSEPSGRTGGYPASPAAGAPAAGPATRATVPPAAEAIVDLVGALAYAELSAFDRLAEDSRLAPSLVGRTQMAAMAAVEMGHHEALAARLVELGADPGVAMEPFVAALETYHALTEPSTWLESVVKAYVGDGMAADFYREVAEFVDPQTRALIHTVLADGGRSEFAVRVVRAAVAEQPSVSGRLALWARRLVGEAISQTQHVLADRDALMVLLMQGTGDTYGIAGVAGLVSRITARHDERMESLGLSR